MIARFLSVDPLAPDYPELTPYQFASNRPIDGIDLDGLEYLDNDEAHLEIRYGKILLRVDNFNRISRNAWNFAEQDPANWSIGCGSPEGCIGLSREIGNFRLQVPSSILPSDLSSGLSMENSYTPDVDPARNGYEQRVVREPVPLKKDGTPDRRYKPRPDRFTSSDPKLTRSFGRGHIVITGILFGLEATRRYATSSTQDLINEHKDLALQALDDINTSLRSGLIPKELQNTNSISNLANYILSGNKEGLSPLEIQWGEYIWENVSIPTMVYPDSGLDNYKPAPIDVNPYKNE